MEAAGAAASLKKSAGEVAAGRKPGAARGRGGGRGAGRAGVGRGRNTPVTAPPPVGGVIKPEAHGTRTGQGLGRTLMSRALRQSAAGTAAAGRRQEGTSVGAATTAVDTGAGTAAAAGDDVFAGTFTKELPAMMYGFGDDEMPLQETVEIVEAALLQYIGAVSTQAANVAASCLKPKMDERDVLFVMRKDPAKFARIKNLIHMQQVIADSRKNFESADLTKYE